MAIDDSGLGAGHPTAALSGSHRDPVPGAVTDTPVPGGDLVEVTLVLRRRRDLPRELSEGPEVVEPRVLARRFGADDADITAVLGALDTAGVQVLEVDQPGRRVTARAAASVLAPLFGAELASGEAPVGGGRFRQRTGGLQVPAALDGVVIAVLGLDDRPQARPRLQVISPRAVARAYTPVELARIYDFPEGDGSGQVVAVIELGGGFDDADLDQYFAGLGVPRPVIEGRGVDGAQNTPGVDTGADGEVMLDVEVIGAAAPGARQVVWFAPNTDRGFLDAITSAVHAEPTPVAISISWGLSEDQWTGQARLAMDEAFADASALGIAVFCAAGDDGSRDNETDGQPHVDFPAASPHVVACGGTRLDADPATARVREERVWGGHGSSGAGGGGVSRTFPLPEWQAAVGVPPAPGSGARGRGVPDVSAVADPATGYRVRAGGEDVVIGGTSAVAPLWAALTARLAQRGVRPVLPAGLYAGMAAGQVPPGMRDVTVGTNGAWTAASGWDPCTGFGVPAGFGAQAVGAQGGPDVVTLPAPAPGEGTAAEQGGGTWVRLPEPLESAEGI